MSGPVDTPGAAAWLLARHTPPSRRMAVSVTCRILHQVVGAGLLLIGLWAVARALGGSPPPAGTVAGWLVGLGMAKAAARYLEQLAGHDVAFRLLADLRAVGYRSAERLAPGTPTGHSGAALSRIMGDVDRIEVFYAHTVAPVVTAVVTSTLALAALAWLDPWLMLTLTPSLLLIGAVIPLVAHRKARRVGDRLRDTSQELTEHVTDTVHGLRDLLVLDAMDDQRRRIDGRVTAWTRERRDHDRVVALRLAATELAVGAGLLAVTGTAAGLLTAGRLDLPGVVLAVGLALVGVGPVLAISDVLPDLDQALAAARRLAASEAAAAEVVHPTHQPADTLTTPPSLTLGDVWLRYPGGPPVLRGIDLQVREGTTLGLVGASGSGKSSLVAVLAALHRPDRGCVQLGGLDLATIDPAWIRRQIAVVDQDPRLFTGTVADNLRLGRPDADDADLWRALQGAYADGLVAAMPDGLDTALGEDGMRLSAGQRQRLTLARALLCEARILVLDEVTANLDLATEAALRTTLAPWIAERTVVIVAHRLTQIRDADHIVVLADGQVAEAGTHADLLVADGEYARLFRREDEDLDRRARVLAHAATSESA